MRIAVLALAAAALSAPAAQVTHERVACHAAGFHDATVTGQYVYESVVTGTIVGGVGEPVSIFCDIRVGTTSRGSTSLGTGTTAAFVTERVMYSAGPQEATTLCAVYSTAHTNGVVCTPLEPTLPISCGMPNWVDGYQCMFTAPLGAATMHGQADGTGPVSVTVEIRTPGGTLLASCSGTSTRAASCTGTAHNLPPGRLICRVRGTGGQVFACADPPAAR